MKLFILLLFSSTTFYANGQTSIYHEFPDSNSLWNFESSGHCFLFSQTFTDFYSITFAGDTVIQGQNYHKLSSPFVKMVGTHSCGVNEAGYKGAIREDVTARKVYYFSQSDTTEKLLYDFTMEVGDTVRGCLENFMYPFI